MTKEELARMALFEVGDTAYVNGLERVRVEGRFYRRSTGTIMYRVTGRWGPSDQPEERMRKHHAGLDPFNDATARRR